MFAMFRGLIPVVFPKRGTHGNNLRPPVFMGGRQGDAKFGPQRKLLDAIDNMEGLLESAEGGMSHLDLEQSLQ